MVICLSRCQPEKYFSIGRVLLHLILAPNILKISHLICRLDTTGIKLTELLHITKDTLEIYLEGRYLIVRKLQA